MSMEKEVLIDLVQAYKDLYNHTKESDERYINFLQSQLDQMQNKLEKMAVRYMELEVENMKLKSKK